MSTALNTNVALNNFDQKPNNQDATRPSFPKRAVVTSGMPYGNKGLHFGHIGGVFIPADMYARFLRNRIGAHNVLFVSGTDCYGSPIVEGHRHAVEAGEFVGTVEDYVKKNHDDQKQTLDAYNISLDIYEGSGLGYAKEPHQQMTNYFFETLYKNGWLERLSTAQFYDETAKMFLNGRQVVGRCPVQGCKSEKAYADECDLGHQFNPEELIAPKSSITNTVPVLKPVDNWYFKLPEFGNIIKEHVENQRADAKVRPFAIQAIEEFLAPPIIYIQTKFLDEYLGVKDKLPKHLYREAEENKTSFELEFKNIEERDEARGVLESNSVRFRTGKTLVPFRLTGNIEWGVKAPHLEGVEGVEDGRPNDGKGGTSTSVQAGTPNNAPLTVWCWPESLWAPISFTSAALQRAGKDADAWRAWWCTDDASVYQFIGEDNIYFYGVAQTAIWAAMQGKHPKAEGTGDEMRQTDLIANHHLLFFKKKASSSGAIKPPLAKDLLNNYNSDQLRAHFLALGLGLKSVSFQPLPYDPDAKAGAPDPVLKESALLTNIFNRLARSCFYTAQKINDGMLELSEVDTQIVQKTRATILEYEQAMARAELHSTISIMDEYLRDANKYWASRSKKVETEADKLDQIDLLANAFYMLKAATVLMEPIAPHGTHKIIEYLNFDCAVSEFLSWEHIFDGYAGILSDEEKASGKHKLKELPPRTDFFEKHPSQFKD